MALHRHNREEREEIQLLRGGSIVSSLAGAFGTSLRETRLTALLGYLIALEPALFLRRFGFRGKPLSVSLENYHGTDRSDIWIETTEGNGVIEAKVDATDPFRQATKYPAKWRVLLTQYIPSAKQRNLRGVTYLRWLDLRPLLRTLSQSPNQKVRFVSCDLLAYLEEHNMIIKKEPVEIYAREINEENSLALFLKARMYCCHYQEGSRLPEARYFAPHFGQVIANEHPGIHVGISYIASVERIEVVETWHDLVDAAQQERGSQWYKTHKSFIEPVRSWQWKGIKRTVLFLAMPRLVFNPPVLKENLQKGSGWLSKRFLSFDELFQAWGC